MEGAKVKLYQVKFAWLSRASATGKRSRRVFATPEEANEYADGNLHSIIELELLTTIKGKMMKGNLEKKILALAAQICRLHGGIAGGRVCQDWTGDTAVLDSLTTEERNLLQFQYEQHNSAGADYEPGYFPYDEMLLSFIVARALEVMATGELPSGGRL